MSTTANEQELRGSATKNGQAPVADKIVLRTGEQIQTATRKELEALSDVASEQFIEAVETRTIEKLAYKILDRSDVIAKGASEKVLGFLPKLLNTDALMESESELDRFLPLIEAA